ncbi:MAG TPA: polysaccharide deacetylase family protein [Candidatus Acetothermia bacterium]|nr:polysaccharide deacetylase family protein [Candidatus Acetothermia bacterium]
MKRLLNRRLIAWLLYYTGTLFLIGFAARWLGLGRPLFLMGHRVLPANRRKVHRSEIDRMALLCGHAITDIEMKRRLKLISRLHPIGDPRDLIKGVPKDNAFYLTFDDGYRDTLENGGPVLRALGIKAVMFVVADLLHAPQQMPWWDRWGAEALHTCPDTRQAIALYQRRCGEQKQVSLGLRRDDAESSSSATTDALYVSQLQLRHGTDVFYVANHTASHPNLAQLTEEEIAGEIEVGTRAICGIPGYLPLFAFPFGAYDERVLSYLHSHPGITMAFATGCGSARDHLSIRRINLNTSPYYLFVAECVGIFDRLYRMRRRFE